jgi:hypothetical protein
MARLRPTLNYAAMQQLINDRVTTATNLYTGVSFRLNLNAPGIYPGPNGTTQNFSTYTVELRADDLSEALVHSIGQDMQRLLQDSIMPF